MATCAEIVGAGVPDGSGEDSVSILPLLRGEQRPVRTSAIHHSYEGTFAIRKGEWVFIDASTGRDHPRNKEPDWLKEERGYVAHDQPGELFNLNDDIAERVNHYASQPELVKEMSAMLEEAKVCGRSGDILQVPDHELSE